MAAHEGSVRKEHMKLGLAKDKSAYLFELRGLTLEAMNWRWFEHPNQRTTWPDHRGNGWLITIDCN